MTTNWQLNTDNNYQIRCQPLYVEPAMILEPVVMDINNKNGFQSFLNVCDFFRYLEL